MAVRDKLIAGFFVLIYAACVGINIYGIYLTVIDRDIISFLIFLPVILWSIGLTGEVAEIIEELESLSNKGKVVA